MTYCITNLHYIQLYLRLNNLILENGKHINDNLSNVNEKAYEEGNRQ